MKNWIILSLSVVVGVLPSLLTTFDAYPKVKLALSVLGILAAGFLVQIKGAPAIADKDAPK